MAQSHNQVVAFPGNLFTYPNRTKKSGWINRIFVTYILLIQFVVTFIKALKNADDNDL